MKYQDFLKQKQIIVKSVGFDVSEINPLLYDFQADIVKWVVKKGKAAIFADCGLGKSGMQLEWAKHVVNKTGENVLILAPLAVSHQTIREAQKFRIPINDYCKDQTDVRTGINITNYERIEKFDTSKFVGIILDESSCLKSYTGKTKNLIVERFKNTPYKLACTATPSPNDHMEILNHAAFLDVMQSPEALAIWFINDTMSMGKYRLKKHCVNDFWQWVSTWAISLSSPSDRGYNQNGFNLPELKVYNHVVDCDLSKNTGDRLFRVPELNATSFHREKRITAKKRAQKVFEIVNSTNEIYVIWCDTNYEADEIKKLLPEAIEVRGSDSNTKKEQIAIDFTQGKIRVLLSKPSIFGFGLNFQICHNIIYCGLSFSFESYYQSVRRFWRFGQENPVNVHIVIGENEVHILKIIKKKEENYQELKTNMQSMIDKFQREADYKMDYKKDKIVNDNYELILGDCVEEIKNIKDDSIHFQIFSPPFSHLYIYSDSYRDMGNNKNDTEFFRNFNFLIKDLYRIGMPGRLCAVHCKQLINYKNRDGASGLRDFRGEIIRNFVKQGWVYHSEICIWKDPVIEMQRTKSHGLLYKQMRKDASYSRQGLPDYLIIFRKWGQEDMEPVEHIKENFKLEKWQNYASPVWMDIQQTNVLNKNFSKDDQDEKHICPLQLDVIERAMELWTNPGDIVFSPFAGIGSEGYVALEMNRRFIGIELKESYFNVAAKNLEAVVKQKKENMLSLF